MDDADLVVNVRPHPLPQPTRREIGVTCGLRQGVPLVVTGRTLFNPFEDFAAVVVDDLDELLATVDDLLDGRTGQAEKSRAKKASGTGPRG